MKNRKLAAAAALTLVIVLAAAVVWPDHLVGPGRLIDGHAALAADCFACHNAFAGTPPERCIVCHKVADIGLRTTAGTVIAGEQKNVAFHQGLVTADCIACHSDHRGVQAFKPISRFSHDLVAADTRQQCAACHTRPGDALHAGIDGTCAQCHSTTAWQPATFDHDRYFRFDREHTTACVTCHVDNVYSSYTCYGCHEHSRSGIRAEHLEEGIRDWENCVKCHRSGDEHEIIGGRGGEREHGDDD